VGVLVDESRKTSPLREAAVEVELVVRQVLQHRQPIKALLEETERPQGQQLQEQAAVVRVR
jgi:hypothetical protein